jgi:hypothetical protein
MMASMKPNFTCERPLSQCGSLARSFNVGKPRPRSDGSGNPFRNCESAVRQLTTPSSLSQLQPHDTNTIFRFSITFAPYNLLAFPSVATSYPSREPRHIQLHTSRRSSPSATQLPTSVMDRLHALEAALEKIVLNPKYHDILTLVKGVRNGIVYGSKVRFPHALV